MKITELIKSKVNEKKAIAKKYDGYKFTSLENLPEDVQSVIDMGWLKWYIEDEAEYTEEDFEDGTFSEDIFSLLNHSGYHDSENCRWVELCDIQDPNRLLYFDDEYDEKYDDDYEWWCNLLITREEYFACDDIDEYQTVMTRYKNNLQKYGEITVGGYANELVGWAECKKYEENTIGKLLHDKFLKLIENRRYARAHTYWDINVKQMYHLYESFEKIKENESLLLGGEGYPNPDNDRYFYLIVTKEEYENCIDKNQFKQFFDDRETLLYVLHDLEFIY